METQLLARNQITQGGSQSKADTLLVRGDFRFYWREYDLSKIKICQGHEEELSNNEPWISRSKVQVVTRTKKGRSVERKMACGMTENLDGVQHEGETPYIRYLSKMESKALFYRRNLKYPMGTPICEAHEEKIEKLVEEHRETETPRTSKADGPGETVVKEECYMEAAMGEEDENIPDSRQFQAAQITQLSRELEVCVNANTKPWMDMTPMTRDKKLQQFNNLVKKQCSILHNDPKDIVYQQFLQRYSKIGRKTRQVCKAWDRVLKNIADGFNSATSTGVKRQILSLVAGEVPLFNLQEYIPNLSSHYITQAKKHKIIWGSGALAKKFKLRRRKFSDLKLEAFIGFITSSSVVSDLPFGEVEVKKTTGEVVKLPNMMRMMDPASIIMQYELYLEETGNLQLLGLSHSTYRRILKVCKAEKRHSAQGIDYFTKEALDGWDALVKIIKDFMKEMPDIQKIWLRMAMETKTYFRSNYKLHVKPQSKIADHCIAHGLSEPDNPSFQILSDHEHNIKCESCENLKTLLMNVEELVESIPVEEERVRQKEIFRQAKEDIQKYKAHQMRTVNQERAKDEILDAMEPLRHAHITMDWAMKWEPAEGRESSKSWFGKRGISWHIAVVLIKPEPVDNGPDFYEKTFIHIIQQSSQKAVDIAAIIRDICTRLKTQFPELEKLYLKSDKAGCYHNSVLLGTIPKISQACGIKIERWDFTEAQSGKSSCDRAAAKVKTYVRKHMAERGSNKCTTSHEFQSHWQCNIGKGWQWCT
jgi:hypothetical protein